MNQFLRIIHEIRSFYLLGEVIELEAGLAVEQAVVQAVELAVEQAADQEADKEAIRKA